MPCFQGFQPGYFQDITSAESAWALNQNSKTCGTVEDILLQPNLTKKFDPGEIYTYRIVSNSLNFNMAAVISFAIYFVCIVQLHEIGSA